MLRHVWAGSGVHPCWGRGEPVRQRARGQHHTHPSPPSPLVQHTLCHAPRSPVEGAPLPLEWGSLLGGRARTLPPPAGLPHTALVPQFPSSSPLSHLESPLPQLQLYWGWGPLPSGPGPAGGSSTGPRAPPRGLSLCAGLAHACTAPCHRMMTPRHPLHDSTCTLARTPRHPIAC